MLSGKFGSSARLPWVLAVTGLVAFSGAWTWASESSSARSPNPIQHIVFVVLENHAYDTYFGRYCPTTGPYCSIPAHAIPRGVCEPIRPGIPSAGCVRPWNFTAANDSLPGMPHDWNSSLLAWDGGRMDGFYASDHAGRNPFGSYNGTTAPIVWDLAEQYALDDNFYSSVMSYSLPNHWHMVAGQAPANSFNHYLGVAVGGSGTSLRIDQGYLNQANRTKSIEDLLRNTSVSWKYYDYPLGSYNRSLTDAPYSLGSAFNYWNPQAGKFESYTPTFSPHFVANTEFYADARSGNLPALSWVVPSWSESDHAPENSIVAQGWLSSVVDALEASPDWRSSAMFVTWDDYGGFFDHVAPPKLANGAQLSFREPLILISPYARENYVSHSLGYFESILHFMEWRFHLGCITALDCTATLPLDMFDFHQAPRPPLLFPTSVDLAHYPMPLQSGGTPFSVPPYYPPIVYGTFETRGPVDAD
jgi:phospholipase C